MKLIHVPADATDLPAPIGLGKHDLLLELPGGHYEWVKMDVEECTFPSRYSCAFQSAPCCSNSPSLEDCNNWLNHVARLAFGDGMWLRNGNARRLGPVGDGRPCSNIRTQAPAAFENDILQEVSEQLSSVFSTQPNERPDETTTKKRKRLDELSLAREVYGKVQKLDVHSDDAKARQNDLLAESRKTKLIAFLVSECNSGIRKLLEHHASDNHTLECRPFAALIQYQQTRGDDAGERLNRLFDEQAKQIAKNKAQIGRSAKGDIWTSNLLSECMQRLRRHIKQKRGALDTLPESPSKSPSKEKVRQERRKEKRSYSLCKIISNISIDKGGDAWGLYPALEASGALLSDIYLMAEEAMDDYAKSAAEHVLQKCNIQDIPASALLIHPAAVLSWLSGEPYDWVCEALGLGEFADEDPGIAAKLDTVAAKYRLHTKEKSIWDSADVEARNAIKIPLGRLRQVHRDAVKPNCRCRDHVTEVATTMSPRSPSQAADEPSTASEHSNPAQANHQSSSHGSVGCGPQSSDNGYQRDAHTINTFTDEHTANSQAPTQSSQDCGVHLHEEGMPETPNNVAHMSSSIAREMASPLAVRDRDSKDSTHLRDSNLGAKPMDHIEPRPIPRFAEGNAAGQDPAHSSSRPWSNTPLVSGASLSTATSESAVACQIGRRGGTQESTPQLDEYTAFGGQVDPPGLCAYASLNPAGAVNGAGFLPEERADWHTGGLASQNLTQRAYDQNTGTIASGALGHFGNDWGSLLQFHYGNEMPGDIFPNEYQENIAADSLGSFDCSWSFLDSFTPATDGSFIANPTEESQ